MKQNTFTKLFLSAFQLSACTFGGGFVIIPLMQKKFVDELHWIEEQEMMDLTAIAQSSPGAIAVNASICRVSCGRGVWGFDNGIGNGAAATHHHLYNFFFLYCIS